MKGLVIDASVAAKWFFEEADHDRALALLDQPEALIAPDHVVAEVLQIGWKRLARGEIVAAHLPRVATAVRGAFALLVSSAELGEHAARLTVELRHPFYDCLYLALAVEQGTPLVLADRRFANVVRSSRYAGLVREL